MTAISRTRAESRVADEVRCFADERTYRAPLRQHVRGWSVPR
ncbi:MAG: hypothetical protein JWQ69_5914 [Pseudomonas sp.]|nr:hypothetical protein [Pseudomonas sp.]